MKTLFPDVKDRKKQMREIDLFARDMQFQVTTRRATKATTKLETKYD
jgi:hypothetical protein